ncbi:MutS-related protein [Pollutimonas bauzanensis]|uniref:MutS domain V n=1 Tax=Pollutimonas bauzanensis TaxID=658167 RepID=A0A1M6ATW3_9BURK|nr:DNA mismatch repair protein MutS [Pollutimonas bauzanensis]SHI06223.1 MutS domain V [Pollutimonas bauzanensis]SHI39861.1 MutS domain V [Pollutimonas bauzanensis]
MTFSSILFPRIEDSMTKESADAPEFFVDLNLDQIVAAITAGADEYNLPPFFHVSLGDMETITYRNEVMQDLEDPTAMACVNAFAQSMRTMREHIKQSGKLSYKYQKEWWFLDAVQIYCEAVSTLARDLSHCNLASAGGLGLCDYLASYTGSEPFTSLLQETTQLKADLSAVQYCMRIKGATIEVQKYGSQADYSASVEKTFEKFKRGAVKDYKAKFIEWPDMNHVEAQVLEFVAQLNPELFERLDDYCVTHGDYLDPTIAVFDREVQFYVAYLGYVAVLKQAGLTFCYAKVSDQTKAVLADECFDLALAHKLIHDKSAVVCNDFYLSGPERIFVVSGPNNGGKTTFARTFGQLHYMASLGCPVAGRQAQLFHFDRLFAHFEREENIKNLRGKLQDDLVRIHSILEKASPNSIVIMNEIFTSTTSQDALFLSKYVLEEIIKRDLLCVCVTFLDELSSMSEKTVSVVSTIVPKNPTLRTYKLVRKPSDGLAYALSLAEKYRLTYALLQERLKS